MTEEDITEFNDRVTEKLGKEQAAVIADDIGILITKQAESAKQFSNQEKEITKLQDLNQKLTIANANLIHQIPMVDPTPVPNIDKESSEPFDYRSIFDANGKIIK